MEKLLVYSLLCLVGYDKKEEFKAELNRLFSNDPDDEDLLELEWMSDKDALSYMLSYFSSDKFNVSEFGKNLMEALWPIYQQSTIEEFASNMFKLWQMLQNSDIDHDEPFYTFCYADDCLSFGDEKQCRELYEKALGFYRYNKRIRRNEDT